MSIKPLLIIIFSLSVAYSYNSDLKVFRKPKKVSFQVRILEGYQCSTEEYPFMVVIVESQFGRLKRKCGGTLIEAYWVLTAAHCILQRYDLLIYARINDPDVPSPLIRRTHQIYIHPLFNTENLLNDIGLILMDDPIVSTRHSDYVELPKLHYTTPFYDENCKSAMMMGWGYTSAENHLPDFSQLQCAETRLLTVNECQPFYNDLVATNLCTLSPKGIDSCPGDSGGPLLCGNLQIGIISNGDGCGIANQPGICTRIDSYIDFINDVVKMRTLNYAQTLKIYYKLYVMVISLIVFIIWIYIN